MKFLDRKKNMRGSLTIEAALIVPIITFLILIVIFFSITIYSMIYASMVVDNATTNIVSRWNDSESANSFHALDMYRSYNRSSLIADINNTVTNEINLKIPVTVDTNVSIEDNWGVFWDYVTINVTCDFKMPLEGMFRLFNSDGKITKVYRRNIQISNSTEGLRVVKYAGNMADSIMKIAQWKFPDGTVARNLMDIVEKVKEGFSEYFN